jgi:hypothetical protein
MSMPHAVRRDMPDQATCVLIENAWRAWARCDQRPVVVVATRSLSTRLLQFAGEEVQDGRRVVEVRQFAESTPAVGTERLFCARFF